jgi:hypothetical protein
MKITLSRDQNHDLNYTGGLVNTWNKFCFTEGYVEGKPTDLSKREQHSDIDQRYNGIESQSIATGR